MTYDRTVGHATAEAVAGAAYDALLVRVEGGRQRRGAALQRSDIVRHIVWAVVITNWGHDAGPAPKRKDIPSAQARDHIWELVRNLHGQTVFALRNQGPQISDEALNRLRQLGWTRLTRSVISERIAVRIASHYTEQHAVPSPDDIAMLVTNVVTAMGRPPVAQLTKQKFEDDFARGYDDEWARAGALNLKRHPPTALNLGPDIRPALTTAGHGGDWTRGLSRSVWSRYQLHLKSTARSEARVPFNTPTTAAEHDCADHEQLRQPAIEEPIERAEEEVRRACAPYGLFFHEHHVVLTSVAVGANFSTHLEAASPRRNNVHAWTAWGEDPCAPVAPETMAGLADPALAAAVAGHTAMWLHGTGGRDVQQRYGPISDHLEDALLGVSRKLWMELHRREREYAGPMRRSEVQRAVKVAVSLGIPGALEQRRLGHVHDADADVTAARETTGGRQDVPGDEEERRLATLLLLKPQAKRVAEWHQQNIAGETSWVDEYVALVAAADEPASAYLTAGELTRLFGEWGGN